VVIDWTDLSGFSGDGTNGFAVLVGVTPGDGYTRVIRDAVTGVTSTDTVSTWGAGGVRVMFSGQDDQQGVLTHSALASGVDANALAAYNVSPKLNRIYDGAGWHILKNGITYPATGVGQGYQTTGSAGTVHVSRLLQGYLGSAPCSLTPFVRSNTRIEDWLPGGAYKGLAYDSSGDGVSAGAGFQSAIWTNLNDVPGVGYGDLEAVCWYQGFANAATATATSYGTSLDALYQQFISWVRQQGRDETTFTFVPVIIHGLASSGANSEYIRKSIMDFVAAHQTAGHKVSFVSALDI